MLRRFITPTIAIKRHASALYVTGDKAKEQFAVLSPYMKFDERLSNLDELKDNIARRKLNINLDDISTEYAMFKAVEDKKNAIEQRKREIADQFKSKKEIANVEGLQLQARHLREDLKTLKANSFFLEDQFVHNYLKLPNLLHKAVPEQLEINFEYKKELINESTVMLSKIDDFLEYFDSSCLYLKGEASKFDLFMPIKVLQSFDVKSYTAFSNPDFVRSVIAQGAGRTSDELFLIREDDIENKLNQLHLTGNGSFINYLGYVAKLVTYPSQFPMKFICTGRQYEAKNHNQNNRDIYNPVQSTCVQTFAADTAGAAFEEILGEHVDGIRKSLEPFNQHFRIVTYPAHQLHPAESFKIGAEMFSPSRNAYVEVGNLAYYHDFISKRILFNYKDGKVAKFPHIYSGTVVNVLKLFLVLMENKKNFKCPDWLME